MFKNKAFILGFVLMIITQLSYSQNNTNSPYTRFGYGDITDSNSGEQRAMGGLSIGTRSKYGINTVNPASYSVVDSMTFMFDVGVSALVSRFSDSNTTTNKMNSNLEYITMQFPLWKKVGFSAGLLPYSFSGYNFSTSSYLPLDTYPDTVTTTQRFYGNGGVNQVYSGLSINLFDHLSLGVNAYYMFGSSINSRELTFGTTNFYPSYQIDSITVSSFRFRYGLQYFNTFNQKHFVSLGAIYEMKMKFNAEFSEMTGSVNAESTPYQSVNKDFEMPEMLGAGIQYTYNNQLTLGFDYTLQKWADAKYLGVTDTLSNRSKFVIGAEYLPNPKSRKFLDQVRYRAGINMSEPYYKLGGQTQPKNFGITFGIGLPLKNSSTLINTTFEYGKIGKSGLLREDYFKFTFNATFNENWFFKRKL
jgi:hypothetical protein